MIRSASTLLPFVVVIAAAVLPACSPVGAKGADCDDGPCAPGLICSDEGICDEPPAPPPPPCVEDSECVLDGDASGRVCDNGVCRFDDCALDAQCGTRICVEGTCAPSIPCVNDGQCDGGGICVDNACRPPCAADDDCGINLGGFGLQACVDGRCLQRCLNDATCLGGGLCEGNICIEPDCVDAVDCGDGNVLCEAGRCTSFTPCESDEGCFDPNLRCDLEAEPVRCVERALCRNDAACGLEGICLDEHCRPAEGCNVDDDCADADDECIGGRCVREPLCRSEDDCAVDERCVGLRCVDAPDPVTASVVEVADDVAPCGTACRRLLFVGEDLDVVAQGYDETGLPVESPLAAVSADELVATTATIRTGFVITAEAPGSTTVAVGVPADAPAGAAAGAVVDVVVVARALADELVVAVVEGDHARAPAGTTVAVGATVVVIDDLGVARFSPVPAGTAILVRAPDGRGVALLGDVVAGTLRLPLPAAPPAASAPLTVTVTSTGDETGPVGLGLVVPSVASPAELTLTRLIGDVVQSPLTLPVIGELPVGVPSSMTLEATIALAGQQTVRAAAEILVAAGPAFGLALEARREQDQLVALALGGDPTAFALELLGDSETADLAIAPVGTVAARAPVEDSGDRDGDGNTAEPVPDFAGAPVVDVRPGQPPQERGAVTASLPDGATVGVVVAGFVLPGRLVPAGATQLRGLVNFEGVPLAESFRAVAASAPLSRARRSVAVIADFGDDDLRSRAFVVTDTLPTNARVGALLSPPSGGQLFDGLPAPGDVTALLPTTPGADLARLRVRDAAGVVDVWVVPAGSVRLPGGLSGGVVLEGVDVFAVGGPAALGVGRPGAIDVIATKAASAPGA